MDLALRFLLLGQLRRLRDEGFEVAAVSAAGPWVPDVTAEGIRHIEWHNATRAWDPAADARAFSALLRILRRQQFDLVHTHTPKAGFLGRIAARVAGVPCVVNTVHGLYAMPGDRLIKRVPVLALERLAARFSDLELYASQEDLAWSRRIGIARKAKSDLLGNGVDLQRFEPSAVSPDRLAALRRDLGLPMGAVVVGAMGRLVAEKGYRELFAAARVVRRALPQSRFLVLGDRDVAKPDAISKREIEQAREDVIFTGWVEDVRDFLGLMDVFVLPSWREGQPLSAIQAAAMGKPLILTDIRGCREVVEHEKEGLLVPPRSAERLTEAIALMVRDGGLRERLGTAARRRALFRYDERKITDRLLDHYEKLLTRKGITVATRAREPSRVQVRPAQASDASALARLHQEALPDAFLSTLGRRFLRRLYVALANDPDAVSIVAEDGDGIVGFATGVHSVRRFYRRFYLRHGFRAALAAAPRLLTAGVLYRMRETARYPTASHDLPDTELLSIAVDSQWRARGIGKVLARGILEGLARRGAIEIKVVVGAQNKEANRFYERMGFRRRAEISVHQGVPSTVLVFRCNS